MAVRSHRVATPGRRWLTTGLAIGLLMSLLQEFVLLPAVAAGLSPGPDAGVDAALADARNRRIDHLPFPRQIQAVAQLPALMGKPYVAGTLDHAPEAEALYVSLDGFDCVTYAETVLALSRTLYLHGDSRIFAHELAALRYRTGQPAYCERLHYFTDWIRNNAARGAVADVTLAVAEGDASKLAFHALPNGVDFMSRHVAKLRALADSRARQQCVADAERSLSGALPRDAAGEPGVAYLDTAHLAQVGDRLRGGDLLALVADAPGLDVIHVGIVLDGVGGGPLRFAHAGSIRSGVSIASDLPSWLAASPRARGALVVRPLAP